MLSSHPEGFMDSAFYDTPFLLHLLTWPSKLLMRRERDQKQNCNRNTMQGNSNPLHNSQANHSGCSCHTIRGGRGNNTEVKGPLWQLTIRFPCTHSETSLSQPVKLLCLVWPGREQDLGHFKGGSSRRKTDENKTQSDSPCFWTARSQEPIPQFIANMSEIDESWNSLFLLLCPSDLGFPLLPLS